MGTEQGTALAPVVMTGGGGIAAIFLDAARFEQLQRAARVFSASPLVPEHMRKEPANCIIALALAMEMDENPLVVMQNIYFVSGKAGWAAQYMIARANRSGVFRGRINWRVTGKGDGLRVTAFATLAETGEKVEAEASMEMAHAEGWTRNSKYKSMPETMLRYRSATLLIRWYAPEVMLGYHTADEIEDTSTGPRAAAGRPIDLSDMLRKADGPADEDVIDVPSEPAAPADAATDETGAPLPDPEPEPPAPKGNGKAKSGTLPL